MTGLSVILPVYNEEQCIERVLCDVSRFLASQKYFADYEIIAVNDGSSDNTEKILLDCQSRLPRLSILTQKANAGYGGTLLAGIKKSRHSWILLMDADGQLDIRDMERFIPYMRDYSMIIGYRQKRNDPLFRIILGKVFSCLVYGLFDLRLKDVNCGFKLIKKESLVWENICSKAGVFYTEALLQARRQGFSIKEIPVRHRIRQKGSATGASPKVVFDAILDLAKLKFC